MNEREAGAPPAPETAPPAPETAPRKTWEDWSRENDKLPGMYPSPKPPPVPIDHFDLG